MKLFSKKKEIIDRLYDRDRRQSEEIANLRKKVFELESYNEELSGEMVKLSEEHDDLIKQHADLKEQYDNRLASYRAAMDAASYWCDKYTALRMEVYGGLPEEECEACQLHLEPEEDDGH